MGRTNGRALDAVILTMYWNKLMAIVDEATAALLRTAFSRTVTDAWDFSCALFDARGEMIAQGRHGLPTFLGCLALAVKDFIAAYPPDRVEPGDSLITTDPWIGASQIHDVIFVTPVFHRGRVVAYAANVSHSPDVGGRLLSADSSEIFEEGFRLPIVKLFRRGEPNDDLFGLIRLNVRVPDIVVGDLLAQLAANQVMTRRVVELLDDKGLDDLDGLAAAILARSEAAMRRAIATIPRGTYRGVIETDGFDRPITLACAITVGVDEVHADFSGSSPQDEHGINCVWRYAFAELAHALICVARPASPVNGATLRPIRFFAPEGTIVNPRYPSALGGRALVSMFIQALVFRALAEAVPDRVIADSHSPPPIPTFMGTRHTGRLYVETMRVNGGLGARPTADGVSGLGWPANISNAPVEVTENEMPMLFLRKELVEDSGGAGLHRGGLGQYYVWRSYARDPMTIAVRLDRVAHPPQGLFSGLPGGSAAVRVDGQPVHSKRTVRLEPGSVFHVQSAGAGGYGDPCRREPQQVLADVLDGYVSPERARSDYQVVVDTTGGAVDWEATRQLRRAAIDA
ncbi:MAG: hydantoinase B/oxoprolinase family protein [Chloroflexi bacterium]|nr:hydantoinase B/oxoprolinase family protein [Chloroflexota bacterium]